jgi:hypothetical protein
MKKYLSIFLAALLIVLSFSPVYGDSSTDDLYEQSGEILKSAGVLTGNEKGDLMLEDNLKRQDLVVLISRLYKQENTAKKHKGDITFKDVNNNFYKPYIAWSVEKKLIVGNADGTFGFDKPVTVQQFQTILLRALGYEEEAQNWDNVPTIAAGLGLMENLITTSTESLSRGLMSAMTINALNLTRKGSSSTLAESLDITLPDIFTVTASPTIDKDTITIEGKAKGADSLKLQLKPASDTMTSEEKSVDISLKSDGRFSVTVPGLESGNWSYRFTNGRYYTKYEDFTIEDIPFEFAGAKADNLKEITLSFSKAIDKESSLFLSNFSTNGGKIKNVKLYNDNKDIVLTLENPMTNNKDYKVAAYKIKSAKGEELSIKDTAFTAADNSIPSVESVNQLGNKGIKIYFSEPLKSVKASNFKIDDKSFVGKVELNDRVVTLTYYSTSNALEEGQHVLTTSELYDFAGYKSVNEDVPFDIITDDEPPAITEKRATLEEVIITFDEDIDPSTVSKTNFYWKSGSSKKYPSDVKVVDNEVILDFSSNKLPNYETTLYITSVGDYSGNKLKDEEIKVTPVIDKTPPEVVSVFLEEDGKSIKVYFSKNVNAGNRTYYILKDKDGKNISIKNISGSGREYVINLFNPLPIGSNTLTIQNVEDTTALKNVIKTYTTTIEASDLIRPKVESYSGVANQIMLKFSKEMDMATVDDPSNYLITFNGKQIYMPKDTEFSLINDNQTVLVTLPDTIDGKEVKIGTSGNLTGLQISRLKDLKGNFLDPDVVNLNFEYSSSGKARAKDYYSNIPGKQAILEEADIIKIRFNQPIISASPDDFSISEGKIDDVICDGSDIVTLRLNSRDETTISSSALSIKSDNDMETFIDTGVEGGRVYILDKVPPRVEENDGYLNVSGKNKIELPFTESLDSESAALFRRDLEITRLSDGYVLSERDYTTSLKSSDPSIVLITIDRDSSQESVYSIAIKDTPQYIMDKDGNVLIESGEYYTDRDF